MQTLSQKFIDECPVENGFRIRGLQTTRIETFVDAAFAFAVTMLVISFDEIPGNMEEMVDAVKNIPAFVAAVAQLVWIWHAHNVWSRRFGLEDAMTVAISAALLIVVLVYIYPLRIMAQGAFSWLSGGWLEAPFDMQSFSDLRFMFVFLGIGFVTLCVIFLGMNAYAGKFWRELRLNEAERYHLRSIMVVWFAAGLIGGLSILLALTLPNDLVPFAGFGYFPLGIVLPLIEWQRRRNAPPD